METIQPVLPTVRQQMTPNLSVQRTADLALSATTLQLMLALIVLYLFGATASAAALAETTMSKCSKGSNHRGLSRCVSQRSASARANLEASENAVREAIAKSREGASYLKPVQEKFDASVRSYRMYRRDQCQLQEAFAAKGNGAAEIRKACEADLDVK